MTRGLLRLPGFLPQEVVDAARDRVVRALEPQEGVDSGRVRISSGVKKARALREVMTPELLAVVAELLDGRESFPLTDAPGVLVTLPNAEHWTLAPGLPWHVDLPRLPEGDIPGVQVFAFLNRVVPGGGGTLVVTGSHRLLNDGRRIRSHSVTQRLRREPYFDALFGGAETDRERFLREPGYIGDVELQVVELCGDPGDVYLTDLRTLHTAAPNAAPTPRIMLTQRYLLGPARDALTG